MTENIQNKEINAKQVTHLPYETKGEQRDKCKTSNSFAL